MIGKKLGAQEKLAHDGLNNVGAASAIARFREAVATAETIEVVRLLESRAAQAYWSAWRKLPINFPKRDLRRIPEHRMLGVRLHSSGKSQQDRLLAACGRGHSRQHRGPSRECPGLVEDHNI